MFTKDNKLRERCGIFGISCNDFNYTVAGSIYTGLMAIQHRGQLGAGISTTNCKGNISIYKGKGLVSKVLNPEKIKSFSGNVGIGHVSYGLKGQQKREEFQPYYFKSDQVEFSIAMNGTITNYDEIYEKLNNMGKILTETSEIELLTILLETLSKFSDNIIDTLKMVMNTIKGAYCMILLDQTGNLYAMRDPTGCKPLCYGKFMRNEKTFYSISSESCSLDVLGCTMINDVKPGEILYIHPLNGLKKFLTLTSENKSVCFFEYTYFARPDSVIDGISVAQVRYNLGKNLAKSELIDIRNAIVVPVPDSGRSAAMGYAWEAGLVYQEGLMKNRYIWELKSSPAQKLNPIKPIVKDNNIVLIDDSILSGNTLKQIISMLRAAGALSVHVRIGCPPIINTCQLNQSFSTKNNLIAFEKKLTNYDNFNEEMRAFIDADTLMYQTIDGLLDSIGFEKNKLCFQCLMEYCLVKEESRSKNKVPKLNLIKQ